MDVASPQDPLPDAGPVLIQMPIDGAARTSLVLASPHSGRCYGNDFVAASRLDLVTLRQNEDSFVDELLADGPSLGVPLIVANFPRVFCDVNREQWELDPEMFSDPLPNWCNTRTPRIAAGHGTIPRIVGSGERIHRRKLRFEEARHRIETCWAPYHQALGNLLEAGRKRDGACLLLDCHSMPPERVSHPADFVLGDNHGTSCAPAITDFVERSLLADGSTVRRNDPYAGGFVTRHYGRPEHGLHVLQIEISRALYLEESTRERRAGFAALRHRLQMLVVGLTAWPSLLPPPV